MALHTSFQVHGRVERPIRMISLLQHPKHITATLFAVNEAAITTSNNECPHVNRGLVGGANDGNTRSK